MIFFMHQKKERTPLSGTLPLSLLPQCCLFNLPDSAYFSYRNFSGRFTWKSTARFLKSRGVMV